ncbi:MAG: hypothetical protein OQL06_04880 [Gammaproteobacteria bacterium]|nr:hypothetical protein [Gammaproteobacteria bacterium]
MKLHNALILLTGLIVLNSCGLKDRKQEAGQLASQFYQNIAQHNYEDALALCADDFFTISSKEEWVQVLRSINDKYGNYKNHHLIKWNMRNVPNSNINDASIGMAHRVIYEKGETIETITVAGAKQLSIRSYDVIPNKRQPRKSH